MLGLESCMLCGSLFPGRRVEMSVLLAWLLSIIAVTGRRVLVFECERGAYSNVQGYWTTGTGRQCTARCCW